MEDLAWSLFIKVCQPSLGPWLPGIASEMHFNSRHSWRYLRLLYVARVFSCSIAVDPTGALAIGCVFDGFQGI